MDKYKNILVEVDEVTASLLDNINSDLTAEVKDGVRDLLKESEQSTIDSLQSLGESISDMHQQTKRAIDKCIAMANTQIDFIEGIKDSLDNLTGLDKIVETSAKLSDSIDSMRERLSSIPAALDGSTDRVVGEMRTCVSEAVTALDSKLEVTSTQLNELTGIINQCFKEVESRMDTLDKMVKESHKALTDEISQHTDSVMNRVDAIATAIERFDHKLLEARNESVSLLNRIIYLCTPFWKRNKNTEQ